MFDSLDASNYKESSKIYNSEFESILVKIISCYKQMVLDNVKLKNDENHIRDYMLSNYLKNHSFKKKVNITDYLFDKELIENSGRVDIRIMPINPFISDEAYYIIECKRLDSKNTGGKTGLNGQYISEGVNRFVLQKYSCYYMTNAMIGFVVENIDVERNVSQLNKLLGTAFMDSNTIVPLRERKIVADFDFLYYSTHKCQAKEITLYHLMFNFSSNILN